MYPEPGRRQLGDVASLDVELEEKLGDWTARVLERIKAVRQAQGARVDAPGSGP